MIIELGYTFRWLLNMCINTLSLVFQIGIPDWYSRLVFQIGIHWACLSYMFVYCMVLKTGRVRVLDKTSQWGFNQSMPQILSWRNANKCSGVFLYLNKCIMFVSHAVLLLRIKDQPSLAGRMILHLYKAWSPQTVSYALFGHPNHVWTFIRCGGTTSVPWSIVSLFSHTEVS